MDFQIIALDIDGTLTDDRKKISSLTLETLIEAEKKGIRLVLASARPAPGLFSIRDQLKMEQFGGILMSYNGGRITDCEGNTFYEISMDLATTRRILRFLEELPVTVIVDDGKIFYVTDKNGYKVAYECRNNQMQCTEVDNLADWLTFSPKKLKKQRPFRVGFTIPEFRCNVQLFSEIPVRQMLQSIHLTIKYALSSNISKVSHHIFSMHKTYCTVLILPRSP